MISRKYQFPKITEDMYNKIAKWYTTHNNGECSKNYHGAIGGDVSFEICPTSIGDFVTVKCSCGATLELNDYI